MVLDREGTFILFMDSDERIKRLVRECRVGERIWYAHSGS